MYYILMKEREQKSKLLKINQNHNIRMMNKGKKLWQDDEEEQDPNYREPQNNENNKNLTVIIHIVYG